MTSISGLGLNGAVGYHGKNSRLGESALNSGAKPAEKTPGLVEVEKKDTSASDRFMEYMNMSDQEKLQYLVLAQMGISKEEYDAMSPEEKAKIDEKVEERLKRIAELQNQHDPQGAERSSSAGKLVAAIDNAQAGERKSILDLSA